MSHLVGHSESFMSCFGEVPSIGGRGDACVVFSLDLSPQEHSTAQDKIIIDGTNMFRN